MQERELLEQMSITSAHIRELANTPDTDFAERLYKLYRAFTPVKTYLYEQIGGEDMTRIDYCDYVRQYCNGDTATFKTKVLQGEVYDMGTRYREHITEEVYIDLDNRKEIVFGLDDDRLS